MAQPCLTYLFIFSPTAPRDKNDDLMGDVRKLSRKVHVGLKRMQSNMYL